MVERVIRCLIFVALIALCAYLVVWVLGMLGIHLPGYIINCLIVIAILLVLLYLWRAFGRSLGSLDPRP